ncbi:hypothetical protein AAG570_006328 [Ranatra chinensis]|uniref:Uncharacterized protein n=1 Tax=Ranatra chinensis TaxID=642074 RepID=A0ABD0YTM8_9HEMI
MQMDGEGGAMKAHKTSFHAFKNIWRNEGLNALYKGFSANLARQVAYTMTRLGLFQILLDKFSENKTNGGIGAQIGAGLVAGGIASTIATPTDVSLIRMTVDGRLPPNERRNYKNVLDAIYRIGKHEGVTKLWTGVRPTVARAMLGNVTQLVPYVQVKQYFLRNGIMEDGFVCHLTSSIIAGFTYAFTTCPLDTAKTRIQSMKSTGGVSKYTGIIDVWRQILKTEGPTALWKGFGPLYFRIAPFTTLMFIFFERLTITYKRFAFDDQGAGSGL